jgi:hypothetical protein
MLKINVRLSWNSDFVKEEGLEELCGVWGETSYNIHEDDLIELAEIEDEVRVKNGEWVEFTRQDSNVCDSIEMWVERKGNLPVGIPLCAKFGSPVSIDFLSYEVIDDEE